MIICGTDFSQNAAQAALAAAALAKRLSAPVKLVHVIDELGAELAIASGQSGIYDPLRQRLRDQATEMGSRFGIDIEPVVVPGLAYEKLVEIACAHQARLIIVSSLGEQKQHRWLLGSVAERVAQTSPASVKASESGVNSVMKVCLVSADNARLEKSCGPQTMHNEKPDF